MFLKLSLPKSLAICGAILSFTLSASAQQNSSKAFQEVRREVTRINKDLSKSKKVVKDVEDISLEGTQATYYFQNDTLQKVVAKVYGETFNAVFEVIYRDGKPIFVYQKHNEYNQPLGTTKSPKVVRVTFKRLYLQDGKVFRATLNNKNSTEEKVEAEAMLAVAEKLLQAAN